MNYLAHKKLTEDEIDSMLKNSNRIKQDDPIVSPILCTASPLYGALWTLSCAAIVFAREHLETLPDNEILLKFFRDSGDKFVGKALLEFGAELDEIKNLTPEISRNIVQVMFEKAILAVNDEIHYKIKYPING